MQRPTFSSCYMWIVSIISFGLILSARAAYLPGEKLIRLCEEAGGHVQSTALGPALFFLDYPLAHPHSTKSKVPVSSSEYICFRKNAHKTLISKQTSNRQEFISLLSQVIIPIPGAPVPWVDFISPQHFATSCDAFCHGNSESSRSQTVQIANTTLGVCVCYHTWPISPTQPMANDQVAIFEGDKDGRIPGCPDPVDPFTYQTCWEFKKKHPIEGFFNMACTCNPTPWPFPDLSLCKWSTSKQVVEAPSTPAVWASEEYERPVELDKVCPDAIQQCKAACASSPPVTLLTLATTNQTQSTRSFQATCFQFMTTANQFHMNCICSDGSYPTQIPGFQLVSSMNKETGKTVGNIDGSHASRLYSQSIFTIVCLGVLFHLIYL